MWSLLAISSEQGYGQWPLMTKMMLLSRDNQAR
jgi:hypothetical protein